MGRYTVLTSVNHDHVAYGIGDVIELDEITAGPLLACGAISELAAPVRLKRRAKKSPGSDSYGEHGDAGAGDPGGQGEPDAAGEGAAAVAPVAPKARTKKARTEEAEPVDGGLSL